MHRLLKFAALKGFPKHAVVQMRRLYRDLVAPGPEAGSMRGVTEARVMEPLLRHVLKDDFTEEHLKQALIQRGKVGTVGDSLVEGSKLFDSAAAEGLFDEDEADDDSDVRQQWEALRKQKEALQAAEARRFKELERMRPQAAAGSGEGLGSASSGAKPGRQFIARAAKGYTAEQAKAFLPAGASISKAREPVESSSCLPPKPWQWPREVQVIWWNQRPHRFRGNAALPPDGLAFLHLGPWRRVPLRLGRLARAVCRCPEFMQAGLPRGGH